MNTIAKTFTGNIAPSKGYTRIKEQALNYVRSMKLGDEPGLYKKEASDTQPSLYGSYHAAHILDMFGELEKLSDSDREVWAGFFQSRQLKSGYFSNSPAERQRARSRKLDELDPVWHSSRGMIWALRILGQKPNYPLTFLEPLLDPRTLYKYVKRYNWANSWAAGNQICAIATALFALRDWEGVKEVDRALEEGMYPALEELMDDKTGFWGTQLGADLPNGLFGTIHVAPIYFAQGWPLPFPERNLDSTLACQLADGSFWPGGSDCPDFDGAYMMMNLARLTDYRRESLEKAARSYLIHALQHEDNTGHGYLLHRRDSKVADWKPRPHFIWRDGESEAYEELRDDDPSRTHIMLGSWFYPLSIALVADVLGDSEYEGPYKLNPASLHQCNVAHLSFGRHRIVE